MRKVLRAFAVLTLALVLVLPGAASVFAEEGEPGEVGDERIDITSKFTDVNFRTEVYRFINKAQGDPIYDTDVAEIKELDVEYKGIKNLSGIEYFIGLERFNCTGNALASLDVSKNTALKELNCSYNSLTMLDVSKNTKLTALDCTENQLTSLDVSKNTALKELTCYFNLLTKLDVSKNTKLTDLHCDNNKLTSLDVSKNTALIKLACCFNPLNSLDVSKNAALTMLSCWSDQLASLDVSKNTKLIYLDCDENQLSVLDITTNTKLETLYCSGNLLTSLDISKNTKLISLWCGYNQLTSLDVSNNTALKNLNCAYNVMPLEPIGIQNLRPDYYEFDPQMVAPAINITDKFTDENFKAAVYEALGKEPGSAIYDIDVAGITELNVSGREITSLAGIRYFIGLEILDCSTNLLTELDLSHNDNLRELDCSHNLMLQPPTGVDSSKLGKYVFDPQDVKKPISALYFIIGGVVLLCLAGGLIVILILKRKKKKAAPNPEAGPAFAPEWINAPGPAVAPEAASWTSLWQEPLPKPSQPVPDIEQDKEPDERIEEPGEEWIEEPGEERIEEPDEELEPVE